VFRATHKETNDATGRGTVRETRLPWSGNDVPVGGTRSFDTESSEERGYEVALLAVVILTPSYTHDDRKMNRED
jgi:hypothetical protein